MDVTDFYYTNISIFELYSALSRLRLTWVILQNSRFVFLCDDMAFCLIGHKPNPLSPVDTSDTGWLLTNR